MSDTTTRIPSAANRSAIARPSPLAAPVTTATRPRRSFIGEAARGRVAAPHRALPERAPPRPEAAPHLPPSAAGGGDRDRRRAGGAAGPVTMERSAPSSPDARHRRRIGRLLAVLLPQLREV